MENNDRSSSLSSTSPICLQLYRGRTIYFTLIGVFCYSLQVVIFRYIEDSGVSMVETLCLVRGLVVLCVVPTLVYLGESPRVDTKGKLLLLLISSVTHTMAVTFFFISLSHMRAGDVTALALTSPIFVGLFGRIFLKETFDFIDSLLVALNLAGVVLIAQPSFIFGGSVGDHVATTMGPLAGLLASLSYASTFLLTRRMGILGVNSFVIVLYHATLGSVFMGVVTAFVDGGWTVPPCGSVRYTLISMAILFFCGACFVTYSYAHGESFIVVILNTNEVIFAYILEFAIFHVVPDVFALLGAALIMFASISVPVKRTDWFQSIQIFRSRGGSNDEPRRVCPDRIELHD